MTFDLGLPLIEFLMGCIFWIMLYHDQSLYETHIVSHIWYFSWPHYIDLRWPLKVKSNIIEFLMGCIFWMVHVLIFFLHETHIEVIYMYMVFQLTSWSLNWMTFYLGWYLLVKLGNMEMILSNIWINFTFGKLFTWTGTNNAILRNVQTNFNFW